MVKTIKYILAISFIYIQHSCSIIPVPGHIKNGFTFCYTGEKTNINDLISTQGYFEMECHNSSTLNLMFYEDGTFLYEFFDVNQERWQAGIQDIPLYLQEIRNDSTGEISSSFYNWFYWGLYKIEGDTVKTQCILKPPSRIAGWSAWETWYKVIDRNTIVEIYSSPLHYMSDSDWENWENYQKERRQKTVCPSKFIPVDDKPAPDCWLKKEDWFWCENISTNDSDTIY